MIYWQMAKLKSLCKSFILSFHSKMEKWNKEDIEACDIFCELEKYWQFSEKYGYRWMLLPLWGFSFELHFFTWN